MVNQDMVEKSKLPVLLPVASLFHAVSQWHFIQSELLTWSVTAAFARARIYATQAGESARGAVRDEVKQRLLLLEPRYRERVDDAEHVANIGSLAAVVTHEHAANLQNGVFRIGPAQKALNLYLKYLWCLQKIVEPPHCPVDAIVLRAAGVKDVAWTQIATLEAYLDCIKALRRKAQPRSLAAWELEMWQKPCAPVPVNPGAVRP